jgi:hypothetical protein
MSKRGRLAPKRRRSGAVVALRTRQQTTPPEVPEKEKRMTDYGSDAANKAAEHLNQLDSREPIEVYVCGVTGYLVGTDDHRVLLESWDEYGKARPKWLDADEARSLAAALTEAVGRLEEEEAAEDVLGRALDEVKASA